MAELTLPAGSRPKPGKTFKAPSGAKRVKTFQIYRWNPDTGGNPTLDSYEVDLDLTTGDRTFASRTTLRFSSSRPQASTFVDLVAAAVNRVVLNGVSVTPLTPLLFSRKDPFVDHIISILRVRP